jgi:hypothetical protein
MTVGYGQISGMEPCKLFSDESVLNIKFEIRLTKYTYLCHESLRTIHELPTHGLNIDVWCAVSVRKNIGPVFFFKQNVTSIQSILTQIL